MFYSTLIFLLFIDIFINSQNNIYGKIKAFAFLVKETGNFK